MKKKLSRSLLFYDIIAFLLIFFTIFIIFEFIIKQIFIGYGIDRFQNDMDNIEYELSIGVAAVEEKSFLDYEELSTLCINTSMQNYLIKAKYDDSAVLFVFPDDMTIGKVKKNLNYHFSSAINYDYFEQIYHKAQANVLTEFNIDNIRYVGLIAQSTTGFREKLTRDNSDLVHPLIIIANKKADFFYLIDLTRIVFILWLGIILGVIAIIKMRLTIQATKEIKTISDMLHAESINIRTSGIIGESLISIPSNFQEVINLNESSIDLNKALIELRNIVKGVTNEEFFIGTITGDTSITEQHEIFCTVMFLDIQGFTTISEKHKAKSMKIGITIFSMVGEVLKKHGGEIRKLLGDAALITFKDKSATQPTSAIRALQASIEVLNHVKALNEELNDAHNPHNDPNLQIDFNFRIGLDTGVVNEGLYGTSDNFEYGIIGDPVNTASRFEGLNKQYYTNILLNEPVFKSVQKITNADINSPIKELYDFSFLILDIARTKGKSESSKIMTLYKEKNSKLILLGSKTIYGIEAVREFIKITEDFHSNMNYWRDFLIHNKEVQGEKAKELWKQLTTQAVLLYQKTNFIPIKQYLKLMLKFEEYEIFENDIQAFIQKTQYDFKIPSEDWLKNQFLARELDK